jgi:hypothetical protein
VAENGIPLCTDVTALTGDDGACALRGETMLQARITDNVANITRGLKEDLVLI